MGFFDDELEFKGELTLKGVLQDFGNKLQALLRENLQNKIQNMTSKELEQSIVFDIQLDGQGYVFELKMADYWKFLEYGTQGASHQGGEYATRKTDSLFTGEPAGSPFQNKAPESMFKYTTKKPPIEELQLWASSAGLNVYAVQNSVFLQGTPPKHFFSEVVDEKLINGLVKDLEIHAKRAIELDLVDGLKGKA